MAVLSLALSAGVAHAGRASRAIEAKAESVLGRRLSDTQKKAVLRAHLAGRGQMGADGVHRAAIGNYTAAQIRAKAKILRQADFSVSERRLLVEKGVVGLASFLARTIGVIDPQTGQTMKIRRERIDDWGSTADYVYVKNPYTGGWERKGEVPGSARHVPHSIY